MSGGRFPGLSPEVARWLDYEQTVNERIVDDSAMVPIDRRSNTVRREHSPEQRRDWPQEVVWLPAGLLRAYGPIRPLIEQLAGGPIPAGRLPLLVHPQPPAAHRRARARYGAQPLGGVRATPTASYRSVLAWRPGGEPLILKLSLGAIVGKIRRRLREEQVARATVVSRVLDTIAPAVRRRLGVTWCSEPAGAVDAASGLGFLLRRLPPLARGCSAVPVFALISRRGARPPLLVDHIRASGRGAEDYVIEELVRPYVAAAAHLLFREGVQIEGHSQNVLVEIDAAERPTGRLVLRDLSDSSVSLAMRLARGRPLPAIAPLRPRGAPLSLASAAMDYRCNFGRAWLFRGCDTVERYGLSGFVWPINQSLGRFFRGYDAERVVVAYLVAWQRAAAAALGVVPLSRKQPRGIATDEALVHFLRHVDWRACGATSGARLPAAAEPLLIGRRQPPRPGRVYRRIDCAWGELYLDGDLPAFFRPAI